MADDLHLTRQVGILIELWLCLLRGGLWLLEFLVPLATSLPSVFCQTQCHKVYVREEADFSRGPKCYLSHIPAKNVLDDLITCTDGSMMDFHRLVIKQ